MKINQKGFTVIEGILIFVIVGVIGFAAWYVYNSNKRTNQTLDSTAQSQGEPQKVASKTTPKDQNKYLEIKEWSVRITEGSAILDANYKLIGNTAWLSADSLDKVTECTASGGYYSSTTPTHQNITRYALNDQVDVLDHPKDGDNKMTAVQAHELLPAVYKQVGNYIYYFNHGNGQPCSAQTVAQTNGFVDAAATLSAY